MQKNITFIKNLKILFLIPEEWQIKLIRIAELFNGVHQYNFSM